MGLAVAASGRGSAHAEEPPAAQMYLIPADEGYGLTECLALGGDCARVVADAWCEAHGHAHAVALGKAEDVTGAVIPAAASAGDSQPAAPAAGAYLVTCGE